jgi:chromosomal replication initiator protein
MPLDEVWKKAVEILERKLNRPAFELLVKRIVPVSLDEGTLYINIPGTLSMEYLREYQDIIEETVSALKKRPVGIVAMQEEAPAETPVAELPKPSHAELSHTPKSEPAPYKKTAPFLNPKYTFDKFVVGASNQLCHNAALSVAEAPGRAYNPLFIYGGSGLGKTHILQAVGHYIAATKPNLTVEYTSTDAFIQEVINCMREKRAHDLRAHYNRIDVLLIDDVHFLEGKDRTQYEFFHIFNEFYEKKKQMVMTCDMLPKDIPTMEDRLTSRLSWGLVCDIQPPDYETRLLILKKKLETDGFFVSEEVIDYVATTIKSHVRNLEGALNRIIAYSKLVDRDITMELAEKIIQDIAPGRDPDAITVGEIIKIVSKHFSADPDEITGKRRKKEIVLPRMVAMFLARDLTKMSLSTIGSEFGGRDHTTVIYSCEKVERDMAQDPAFKKTVAGLREKIKG